MKPRYIFITVAVIILLVAGLCEISREIGRNEVRQSPAPSPWSVVCDNQGHYSFTDEDGDIWPISEWSTYEEAMLYCVTIKKLRESYRHGNTTDEERRRYNEIAARKWEACPP